MDTSTQSIYRDKISQMMYGFGDNPVPNLETVKLVESVVLKQLREILHEAARQANRRNTRTINPEDIIFLLRHDRHKMQRFVKYLDYKYVDLAMINGRNTNENKNRKRTTLRSFIESIDETGELLDTNEFDTVKHERAVRADRISWALDDEKYKEYVKARRVSFFSKNYSVPDYLRTWVDPQHELNIPAGSIEILELLAYGIVGHITDMALIVRQNSRRVTNDPVQMLRGSFFNSNMFSAPHIPSSTSGSSSNIHVGQPPLTVNEIREVLRRCYMPQVGYMKFSNKSMLGKRKLFLY